MRSRYASLTTGGRRSFPDSSLRDSTYFVLRYAAARMGGAVEYALSEHGLSWPQYLALRVACERPGLSQQALAERIAVDKTCMSRTIELLEDRALVHREPGIDRRQRLVRVTDAGRAWRHRFDLEVEAAERAALLPLDPRERERVRRLLGKLISEGRPTFLDFLY